MSKSEAAIYIRVSTEDQTKGNSLENQEVQSRQYCTAAGYSVARLFVDVCSAKSKDNREQLNAMIRYCEENHRRIAAVVIWKFDRIARNAGDHLVLKGILAKRQIQLKS